MPANPDQPVQKARLQLILVHAKARKTTPVTWLANYPIETLSHSSLYQVIEYTLIPALKEKKPTFLTHESFDANDPSTLPVLLLQDQPSPVQIIQKLADMRLAPFYRDIKQWHYMTDIAEMLQSPFNEKATHFLVFEPGIQFDQDGVLTQIRSLPY